MQPLVPFKPIPPSPEKVAALRQFAIDNGQNPDDVEKGLDLDQRGEWWGNDTYVVIKLDVPSPGGGWPDMVWLSIRRQDREAIHDWRHFQAIKNQLVGEECEGCELFPAESRVVDTANQYHLWCFKHPGVTFPFGFGEGIKTDTIDEQTGAQQRARA